VKYYIVPSAAGDHREFLYEIAAQLLGDGGRYDEIFRLNSGRLQPDGRRLETLVSVDPGWILILPADAAGPGVRTGVPPYPRVRAETRARRPATTHPRRQSATAPPVRHADAVSPEKAMLLTLVVLGLIALAWIVTRRWHRSAKRGSVASKAPRAVQARQEPATSTKPIARPAFRPGLMPPTTLVSQCYESDDSGPGLPDQLTPAVEPGQPLVVTATPDDADADDLPWPDYLMA
jgi:hypothetical protein